jgi:predicted GNAT family acetyltransferase
MAEIPTLTILKPGDEAALEAFLRPRMAASMFLLGNMRRSGLHDTGKPYGGTYAARVEGTEIAGVVAHYWNGMLIFQAPGFENPLWRAAVRASGRPIAGLIGPNAQVTVAKEALRIEDAGVQMDETETLYALDLADLRVPDALRAGRVEGRRIERGDLDRLTAWAVAYNVEAIGAEESSELWESRRTALARSLDEGDAWVLEHDGDPVAMSGFNTAIAEAVQVGGVYTPPALRRRGYARCVVAASLLDARAEGAEQAILFTGKQNVPAQRAYEALGFRPIGDYRILILRDPIAPPV